MLAALLMRGVGRWIGRLVGRRERPIAARGSSGRGDVGRGDVGRGDVAPIAGGETDEPPPATPSPATPSPISARRRAAANRRPVLAPDPSSISPAQRAPVEPDAKTGTVEPLREAARRSLVPRWLAAVRTQVFSGLAGVGLLLFGGMTALVTGGLTAEADLAATQAVQAISLPWLGPLMLGVSAFGFPPLSLWIVGGVAALFWLAGYRAEAGFAVVASASAVLTQTIKVLVARPRPDAELVAVIEGATGHSFPSGHTLFYVTFFGFLAYAAYAQLKPGRFRTAVLWCTGLLILLVGPSRIWMGQHWASDVLASYALGLTYLVLLVQAYARYRFDTPERAPSAIR